MPPQQEVLTEALAAEWTRAQAAVLERTEGVESVSQAVQRVAARAPQVGLPSACQRCLYQQGPEAPSPVMAWHADGSLSHPRVPTPAAVQAAEEVDWAAAAPVQQHCAEPRVASFKWAARLGAPTSGTSDAADSRTPSPQAAGMLVALGELSAAYLDAAKQHVGDLLCMADAQQQLPAAATDPAACVHAAALRLPPTLDVCDGAPQQAALTQRQPGSMLSSGSRGPHSRPPGEAVPRPEHRLPSSSSSIVAALPASPPTSPFERAAGDPHAGPSPTAASGQQPGIRERGPPRRDSSAHARLGSGLAEADSTTSWGSFRDSEHPAPFQGIPETPEEAASRSSEPRLSSNGHMLDAVGSDAACADAACFLPVGPALSAPALLRLYGVGTSRSSSPAAASPAQSWQAGDEGGLADTLRQDPFAIQQPPQLDMRRESSSSAPTKGLAKPSVSQWEQEQIARFAAMKPSAADAAGDK